MVAEKIRSLVVAALDSEVSFTVERPSQAEHGDYATNAALVVAKQQGENPRAVAAELQKKLTGDALFSSVEVAGPGFLNFTIAPAAWQEALKEILKKGDGFGRFTATQKTVELEFISGNPTGPLTLANGRGGFGGDVLARILKRFGHRVSREYYVNDAGNQIKALGETIKGEKIHYAGEYVKDLAKQVDQTVDAQGAGEAGAELMLAEIKRTASQMNIEYDVWFSERKELHRTGLIEKVLHKLSKAGATYEKDGALWLGTSKHGDDKDRVLRKKDGELTYLAADLAHYHHKFVTKAYDQAILIVGPDHHGYVARMQAGVELLRQVDNFQGTSVILVTQVVRLIKGGQEVKMSKRAGTYVALDDLLEEIPVDVARFFFVMKSFDTHMDFDMDLAKEQSQKNPVYYLKYAHARIAGILDKSPAADSADLTRLKEPAELLLIKELSAFPALVKETAGDYQVHRIPHYALGLADAFHKFYEQCRVISDDPELTVARLQLVRGTQIVLQNIGDTLGIEMPDNM